MILAKQGPIREYSFRDDVWRYDLQNATIRTWHGGATPKSGMQVLKVPFDEERLDRVKVVAMDAKVFSQSRFF